jgi:hypothetical protein
VRRYWMLAGVTESRCRSRSVGMICLRVMGRHPWSQRRGGPSLARTTGVVAAIPSSMFPLAGMHAVTAPLHNPLLRVWKRRRRACSLSLARSAAVDGPPRTMTLGHIAAVAQYLHRVSRALSVDRDETGEDGTPGAAERSRVALGCRRAPTGRGGRWRRPAVREQRAFEAACGRRTSRGRRAGGCTCAGRVLHDSAPRSRATTGRRAASGDRQGNRGHGARGTRRPGQ